MSDGETLRQVIQSGEAGIQGLQMLPVERCQTGTKRFMPSAWMTSSQARDQEGQRWEVSVHLPRGPLAASRWR